MKTLNKILASFLLCGVLIFTACEDRSDLTAPGKPNSGSADFTTMVSIGNSLTAAFANNALYESSQEYGYTNLIAKQVGANFVQPLITDPGIAGRLEISQVILGSSGIENVVIAPNANIGSPINSTYAAPYNNLGIPGAILYDLVDETDFAAKSLARKNPFFQVVLRDTVFGKSVVKQALKLNPTFVTLWIGNNDVLGYATSGGTRGTDLTGTKPTDGATFAFLYNQVATALNDPTGKRKVVTATIPNVTAIPFFTTVGPKVGYAISQAQAANPAILGLFYQKTGETIASGLATTSDLLTNKVLLTLTGSSYASLIGQATDKFYTDNGIPIPAGIDVTKPFGLHPQNPWPNAFILDLDEQANVSAAVSSFNSTIQSVATANGWGVVDINKIFQAIKDKEATTGPTYYDGVPFSTTFLSGNLFSLDGVHPTSQGYAVVANEFIKVINTKFGGKLPLINVSTIPGSIKLSKEKFNKKYNIKISPNALSTVSYF
ncbi:MAG: hypothetical protein CO129_03220 [Ignavibacteriales bacterium CG_4_9_14_3_um_filter_34_10]|nr:MAG: hypothetical protein CO129_03220 [Ignavibacteriales bacterium CG_4_9_14_3_um_filter_34_10]